MFNEKNVKKLFFSIDNLIQCCIILIMKTSYERFIELSDYMCLIAIAYYQLKEYQLAKFYKNASIGYKERALKLNVC